MQAALDTGKPRQQLAAALDKAGQAFLAVLDELVALGNATQSATLEAAQIAVPFHSGFMDVSNCLRLMDQRMLLIDETKPHAGAFSGPDMQYAMVIFLTKVLDRLGNRGQHIAQISAGWQFDSTISLPFAEAAQRAHERLSFGAQRIELCLQEPT
jgi:hypothetical protein